MKAHRHAIRLPGGRRILTEYDILNADGDPVGDMFDSGFEVEAAPWEYDEEVGFLPLIGGLVSSLFGGMGGGDKAAPAPAAAPAPVVVGGGGGADIGAIIGALTPAIKAAGIPENSPLRNVSADQMRSVVKELLQTVPVPVRRQVTQAVEAIQGKNLNASAKLNRVVAQVDNKFKPKLQATLAALTLAKEQREATSEHKGIIRNEKRWRKSAAAQRAQAKRLNAIMGRIDAIGAHVEERLGGKLAIVRGGRRIDILGGSTVLGRGK